MFQLSAISYQLLPKLSFCASCKNAFSKSLLFLLFVCCISVSLTAQSYTVADSTWLTVYNTGKRYQLKNAPFGDKKPKKGVVQLLSLANDSITVRMMADARNFKPFTLDELKQKAKILAPKGENRAPQPPTNQELEALAANKGTRTCLISSADLKGKVVLVDFDPNCDPTYKCLQAQRAGATTVIVIANTDKKDSLALVKGRFADSLRIPCFSILKMQGDSIRQHLPSKVALFTPQIKPLSLERANDLTFIASKDNTKSHLNWEHTPQADDAYFVIERSADGVNFTRLGQVDNKGSKTYSLDDDNPLEDDNFYRLIVKRTDGTETVTEPQLLNFPIVRGFDVYPNPTSQEITIHFKQFDQQSLDLMLYDAIGKQIYKEHIDNIDNTKRVFNLAKLQLSQGYYTFVVLHKGKTLTKQFMFTK